MPVTLSGNACSQPEHPQSAEPTELSRTERGLNRDARSPWTCMEKKGQVCYLSTDPWLEVWGPAPGMNAATTVAANFIFSLFFMFFLSVTLVLWNADAHEKYRQVYKNKIQLPNVQGRGFTADVALCLPRRRKKTLPMRLMAESWSSTNTFQTTGKVNHCELHAFSTIITN